MIIIVREIEAKSLLTTCKNPSAWFGVKYNLNIYRGCEHQCIYCDSRSECYHIEDFSELLVKTNAPELLKKELASKRKKGTVGTGAMGDPYTISEKKYLLTRKVLEIVADYHFPIHITTKSNLILRDLEVLQEINNMYASVAITLTTTDDDLARKLEPYAPSPTDRLKALGILSILGIHTSVTMMPILPYIEDSEANIIDIIEKSKEAGVKNIVPYLGVTLRDRQRSYFYQKLDALFPETKEKYIKRFGERYNCSVNNSKKLYNIVNETCHKYGISTKMPTYEHEVTSTQLHMFDL